MGVFVVVKEGGEKSETIEAKYSMFARTMSHKCAFTFISLMFIQP